MDRIHQTRVIEAYEYLVGGSFAVTSALFLLNGVPGTAAIIAGVGFALDAPAFIARIYQSGVKKMNTACDLSVG